MAYRIVEDEVIIERQSDDGEPSGTAGAPMLEILKGYNLCNVLVIVTRYFGGILLGTGGLVRAYSDVTIKAIENNEKVCKCFGYLMEAVVDYNVIENFKYYCKNNSINILEIEYLEVIKCKIELDNNKKKKLINDIDNKKINVSDLKVLCKKYINKSVEK